MGTGKYILLPVDNSRERNPDSLYLSLRNMVPCYKILKKLSDLLKILDYILIL